MPEFHETGRGQQFYDGTMRKLAEAAGDIAGALDKLVDLQAIPAEVEPSEGRTEDVASLMPRLRALRAKTATAVNLSMNVWVYESGEEEVAWECWAGSRNYGGGTAEEAVARAEGRPGMGSPASLAAVVLPINNAS